MADYLLCSSPRTGSTWLCELLAATKIAGEPNEFFEPSVEDWFRSFGYADFQAAMTDIDGYMRKLRDRCAGPNGIFGMKAHSFQLERAIALGFSVERHLAEPRYVCVRRRDKLAQAVSMVKAMQTWQWSSLHLARAPAVYDRERIAEMIVAATRWNEEWDAWFAQHGVKPLVIFYDDLASDPVPGVMRVASHIGVDAADIDAHALATPIALQRDEVSAEWAARFLSEQG